MWYNSETYGEKRTQAGHPRLVDREMPDRAIAARFARGGAPVYKWGPKLPRTEWARVEAAWMRRIVLPRAMAKIAAEHSLYARDYNRFMSRRVRPSDRQSPDEDWSE